MTSHKFKRFEFDWDWVTQSSCKQRGQLICTNCMGLPPSYKAARGSCRHHDRQGAIDRSRD